MDREFYQTWLEQPFIIVAHYNFDGSYRRTDYPTMTPNII